MDGFLRAAKSGSPASLVTTASPSMIAFPTSSSRAASTSPAYLFVQSAPVLVKTQISSGLLMTIWER